MSRTTYRALVVALTGALAVFVALALLSNIGGPR